MPFAFASSALNIEMYAQPTKPRYALIAGELANARRAACCSGVGPACDCAVTSPPGGGPPGSPGPPPGPKPPPPGGPNPPRGGRVPPLAYAATYACRASYSGFASAWAVASQESRDVAIDSGSTPGGGGFDVK